MRVSNLKFYDEVSWRYSSVFGLSTYAIELLVNLGGVNCR
jgi:hypothetical protein